jgi:hypothetical protein
MVRAMEAVARGEEPRTHRLRELGACARPDNLRRTAAIALVVGAIFTLVNETGTLAHGGVSWVTGLRIAVNFLVPFAVSNLGVITAERTRRR